MEKRKHERTAITQPVRFRIIIKNKSEIINLQLEGTIMDICAEGFSLLTAYPLVQGHLLTIIKQGRPEIPRCGIVRWVNRNGSDYKAGLRHIVK